jgi:hypothetical protein
MEPWMKGIIAGSIFAIVTVAIMLPMRFDDKRAALAASFVDRFAIGFLIAVVVLPLPGWLLGLLIGLVLSVPQAIITRSYGPIIGNGVIGGTIIGFVLYR